VCTHREVVKVTKSLRQRKVAGLASRPAPVEFLTQTLKAASGLIDAR
jgi:hypothetical protein